MNYQYDVVVVGGGISGLYAAYTAAQGGLRVAVVSKVHVARSHSVAAQGGIAASLGNEEMDRWEWHFYDTVKGSDFLADQDAAEVLAKEAPAAVYALEHLGVPFSRDGAGKIDQRRFGGHTKNFGEAPIQRACYVSDRTGRAIMDTLYDHCLQANVVFHNEVYIHQLLFSPDSCCGAAGYDLQTTTTQVFHAKAVVLATGGCGKIYQTTSNGFASTGDGLALALDAHVPLQDMEFMQFHPTGIYGLGILISEAARAEGGVLRNRLGERFMERYAPTLLDLAPRDIVSRAILCEVAEGRGIDGKDYVYLDLRGIGKERLSLKLPEILSFVKTYLGIDAAEAPIPVAPTCHYMMGGIPTDTYGHVLMDSSGKILPSLYAVGECGCVSVHGANRLGCNSLIDLVVFGNRAGQALIEDLKGKAFAPLPYQAENVVADRISGLLDAQGFERVSILRESMQKLMTANVSVFRDKQGLIAALKKIRQLKKRSLHVGLTDKGTVFNYELAEALEFSNMLRVAECIVACAISRTESRGAHFRSDYPKRNDNEWLMHTLIGETASGLMVNYKPVSITQFTPQPRRY
ncbi:MAG: succinate dehydrogenase flavoprotein subunit [Candidatus Bathyarchaeota archaeon]|nr:succinate dehydrogenase flavoprotein subunit [Candidatus Bathyarchaeota archaeon]